MESLFESDTILVRRSGQNNFSRTLWNPHPDLLMGKKERNDETQDHQAASDPHHPDAGVLRHLKPCIFLGRHAFKAEGELLVLPLAELREVF